MYMHMHIYMRIAFEALPRPPQAAAKAQNRQLRAADAERIRRAQTEERAEAGDVGGAAG